MKKEFETILEWDVLPVSVPEFPTVTRMTLGMNSPMVVASLHARASVEKQQKEFRDILRTLKGAELENKLPIYDDGRMVVQEGHIALKI